MSEHKALLKWERETEDFGYKTYNREHTWEFKNKSQVRASAATAYLGKADCVDPEEAFVASLASCHMLTFLAVASMQKFIVDSYQDEAIGFLTKNEQGKLAITKIVLKPVIQFSGDKRPTEEDIAKLHEKAHHECFIANSVHTEIVVE